MSAPKPGREAQDAPQWAGGIVATSAACKDATLRVVGEAARQQAHWSGRAQSAQTRLMVAVWEDVERYAAAIVQRSILRLGSPIMAGEQGQQRRK